MSWPRSPSSTESDDSGSTLATSISRAARAAATARLPRRQTRNVVLYPPAPTAPSTRSSGTAPSLAYSHSDEQSPPASVMSARMWRTGAVNGQVYRLPDVHDSREEGGADSEDQDAGETSADDDGSAGSIALMPPLPCPYSYLNQCGAEDGFSTFEQWDTHCRRHFHPRPPYTVRCPFVGCTWQPEVSQDEPSGWEQQRHHIRQQHLRSPHRLQGQINRSRREHHGVLYYFWSSRIIDDSERMELERTGRLQETYTLHHGLRDGRRQRWNR